MKRLVRDDYQRQIPWDTGYRKITDKLNNKRYDTVKKWEINWAGEHSISLTDREDETTEREEKQINAAKFNLKVQKL